MKLTQEATDFLTGFGTNRSSCLDVQCRRDAARQRQKSGSSCLVQCQGPLLATVKHHAAKTYNQKKGRGGTKKYQKKGHLLRRVNTNDDGGVR